MAINKEDIKKAVSKFGFEIIGGAIVVFVAIIFIIVSFANMSSSGGWPVLIGLVVLVVSSAWVGLFLHLGINTVAEHGVEEQQQFKDIAEHSFVDVQDIEEIDALHDENKNELDMSTGLQYEHNLEDAHSSTADNLEVVPNNDQGYDEFDSMVAGILSDIDDDKRERR